MKFFLGRAKQFYKKYERYLSAGALLVGFIIDNFTLTRIDQVFDNLILLSYLAIAAGGIFVINFLRRREILGRLLSVLAMYMPLIVQFSFGGLFSGFFVFYTRSGSLATSWFFILLLVGLLIGNEFFRKFYQRLEFQLSLFFLAVFSYTIFALPVVLGRVGVLMFILSGFLSLFIVGGFMYTFRKVDRPYFEMKKRVLLISIFGIYLFINGLYFLNIIPPIPLSLKEASVYHKVERISSGYLVTAEDYAWYDLTGKLRRDIRITEGSPVYFFSSVFAPTRIETTVIHRWSYFDSGQNRWVESARIPIAISGGSDRGYRGYSIKRTVFPGRWRVDVINERGQVLGRDGFTVTYVAEIPPLETKTH